MTIDCLNYYACKAYMKGRVMAKVFEMKYTDPKTGLQTGEWVIKCPACKVNHSMNVDPMNTQWKGITWQFNGNIDKPTFSPSLIAELSNTHTCHSFIIDGQIQFLSDCTHAMAGQNVELPEVKS